MRALGLRLLKYVGLALVLAIGGIALVLWETLPAARQSARISGLSAPVDIRFDADGVPHIRAATERDAIADTIQLRAFDLVPSIPLGTFQIPTAYRRSLTGMIEATGPYMWNIRRV